MPEKHLAPAPQLPIAELNNLPDEERARQQLPTISAKHEVFCQAVLDGMTQTAAYMKVYDKTNADPGQAAKLASRIARRDDVKAWLTIQRARERIESSAKRGLTRERKREILASIAELSDADRDRLNAIKIDNSMEGHDAPKQVEVESTVHHVFSAIFNGGSSGFVEAVDDTPCIDHRVKAIEAEPVELEEEDESDS